MEAIISLVTDFCIMDNKIKRLLISVCILSFLHCYKAYPSYQNEIPNGYKVRNPCKDQELWTGVGHRMASGGGDLNKFGLDLYKNKVNSGKAWTKTLCETDSDGDGLTNGQELGDPMCNWSSEVEVPLTNLTITHPGICEPMDSENCRKMNDWLTCDQDKFDCPQILDPEVKILNLRMPETEVQQNGSRYICTHLHVPIEENYHVIAVKPFLDYEEVVHHIILFGCDVIENMPKLNDPQTCDMSFPSYCTQLNVWTIGIPGECFPDQFGLPIGSHGFTNFMLQIHWHNHDNRPNVIDSSGMTLYYTPRLRPHNSAVLVIGQTLFSLEPRKSRVVVDGTCPGLCTKKEFKGPIYIYSAFNHMHALGREQKIEHYRNGTLMNVLTNEVDFSFKQSSVIIQKPPVEVLPGDELRTTCTYDTTSTNTTTTFGSGAENEMCFGFLTFYPRENIQSDKCVSWATISHCVWGDLFKIGNMVARNPWMKAGIQTMIKGFTRHG